MGPSSEIPTLSGCGALPCRWPIPGRRSLAQMTLDLDSCSRDKRHSRFLRQDIAVDIALTAATTPSTSWYRGRTTDTNTQRRPNPTPRTTEYRIDQGYATSRRRSDAACTAILSLSGEGSSHFEPRPAILRRRLPVSSRATGKATHCSNGIHGFHLHPALNATRLSS